MKDINCVCNLDELIIENVPLLLVDTISSNRNYYPKEEVIKAIEFYNKLCDKVDPTYRYMLIRHPKIIERSEFDNGLKLDISDISYEKVAGWLEKVYYDEKDNVVYGDVKVLNTKDGLIVRYLYEKGFPIGFSVRLAYMESEEAIDENHEKYYIKKGLIINGWDFTINPSFVFTWIKKDERGTDIIKRIKNQKVDSEKSIHLVLDEKNIEVELKTKFHVNIEQAKLLSKEIVSLVNNINENKKIKNNSVKKEVKMDNEKDIYNKTFEKMFELEKMALKKERLDLEIKKLEQSKSEIEEELKRLYEELEKKHNKISEVNKELEIKENELIITIGKIDRYKDLIENLEKNIQEKTEKLSEIEKILKEKEEVEQKRIKDGSLVVKYKDKEFSLSNPPKIKVVKDKISEKSWGNIDKTTLRKLLYLTQDKDLIYETFGIVEDINDYSTYKYPHHELVESEDEKYDFELVLNTNGLRTALVFATGFAGRFLTKDKKEELGKHLLHHYEYLKKERYIEEIPPSLNSLLGKKTNVEIFIKADDELLNEIREEDKIILEKTHDLLLSLIDNEIIKVEGFENFESIEIELPAISKLVNVMSKQFIHIIQENINDENYQVEQNTEMEEYVEEDLIMNISNALRYYYDNNESGKSVIDRLEFDINDINALTNYLKDVFTKQSLEKVLEVSNIIKEAIVFKTLNEEFIDLDSPTAFIVELRKANEIILELAKYFRNELEEDVEIKEELLEEPTLEPEKDYVILDKNDVSEEMSKPIKDNKQDINIDFLKENLINKAIIQMFMNKASENDVNKFLQLIENDIKDKEEITLEEFKGIVDKNLNMVLKELKNNKEDFSVESIEKIERKGNAMVESVKTITHLLNNNLFDKLLKE